MVLRQTDYWLTRLRRTWQVLSRLVPLVIADKAAVVMGKEPVYVDGRPAGYVTSAGYGYSVDAPIALAWLPAGAASVGRAVTIELLLCADSDTGKRHFAMMLAQFLLCANPAGGAPCGLWLRTRSAISRASGLVRKSARSSRKIASASRRSVGTGSAPSARAMIANWR